MVLNRNFRVFLSIGAPRTVALMNRATGQVLLFDSAGRGHELAANEFEPVASTFIKWRDVYGCMGILPVPRGLSAMFCNLDADTVNYLALVTECKSVGKLGHELFHISAADFLPLSSDGFQLQVQIITDLKKLFARASFYFSTPTPVVDGEVAVDYDITAAWHAQLARRGPDERFFWNHRMWEELEQQGLPAKAWMLLVMRGSVEVRTAYISQYQAKTAIISRMSCERTGQRFLTRGVDDDGNAANFVETEQIVLVGDYSASFIMARGSVPIFWEQPGLQMGSLKIKLSRGFKATQPAFDSHVGKLLKIYGHLTMVSLLGRKEGEYLLNSTFQKHAQDSALKEQAPLVQFDVNHHCKGKDAKDKRIQLDPLLLKLRPFLDGSGFFEMAKGKVLRRQSGVVRFNCLDCLDRSNFVQSVVGSVMLDRMLAALREHRPELTESKGAALQTLFRDEWGVNGDNVSRCVTGTAAITSGNSTLKEVSRTVTRAVKNNFYDSSTQTAIDTMLGANIEQIVRKDNAVTDPALRGLYDERMLARQHEFTDQVPINICIGTWNVNGGKHFRSVAFKGVTMADWLVSPIASQRVDVYAVGFEEMVDLTAQNMVATAQKHRQEWADELTRLLGAEYALVTSVQLVGVCLYILIRNEHLSAVKEVVTDTVKTGAGGRVGNKGGVAVRMRMYNSTICFVCAHLAAGQSHVAERNSDYSEITRRLTFGKGRTLATHDYTFWCGDFNYRIDLPIEECKTLIAQRNWSTLLAFDQLTRERQQDKTFVGFTEGNVAFPPTYKYDLFSDDWDTSEKCRCPAWTDRVLYRGDAVELLHYGRNETLKTSDHRPVMALARVALNRVDEYVRDSVREEVLQDLRKRHATATVSVFPVPSTAVVEDLVALFSPFGAVVLVVIEGDTAMVTFATPEEAAAALALPGDEAAAALQLATSDWHDHTVTVTLVEPEAAGEGVSLRSASVPDDHDDPEFQYGRDDDDMDAAAAPITAAPITAAPAGAAHGGTDTDDGSEQVPLAKPRAKSLKKRAAAAASASSSNGAESGGESGGEQIRRNLLSSNTSRSSALHDGSGAESEDDGQVTAAAAARGHRASVALTAAETAALQESLDAAFYSSDDESYAAKAPARPAPASAPVSAPSTPREPPARPAAAPVKPAAPVAVKSALSKAKAAEDPKPLVRHNSLARDPKKSIELSGDDGISMPYNVVHQTHANMVDGIMAISKPQRVIPRTHRDLPPERSPAVDEDAESAVPADAAPAKAAAPSVAIPPPPTRPPAPAAAQPARPAPVAPAASAAQVKATPVKPAPPVSRQPAPVAASAPVTPSVGLYEPPGVSDTAEPAGVDPLAAAVAAAEATRARVLRGAVNVFGGPPPPLPPPPQVTGSGLGSDASTPDGPVAAPRRRAPVADGTEAPASSMPTPSGGGKQPPRPPAPQKSAAPVPVLAVAHDPENDDEEDEGPRPATRPPAPAPAPALPPPPAVAKVALQPPSRPAAPPTRPGPPRPAPPGGPDLLTFSAAELAPDLIAFESTTDAGIDGFDPLSGDGSVGADARFPPLDLDFAAPAESPAPHHDHDDHHETETETANDVDAHGE